MMIGVGMTMASNSTAGREGKQSLRRRAVTGGRFTAPIPALLAGIALGWCVPAVQAHTSSATTNQVVQGARYEGPSLMLPAPIRAGDVERFADILRLTEDQRVVAEAFAEEHLQQYRAEVAPLLQELQRGGAALSAQRSRGGGAITPAVAEGYAKLMDQRTKVERLQRALEDELFTSIESLLDDEQLPAAQRMRGSRERDWSASARGRMPGMAFDLMRVIDSEMLDELAEEQRQHVELLLMQYETALTPLHRARNRSAVKVHTEEWRLTAEYLYLPDGTRREWDSRDDAIAHEQMIVQRRTRLNESHVRLEGRIRRLNADFVSRIGQVVPPRMAFTLWTTLSQMTYVNPRGINDTTQLAINRIFNEVLDRDDLTDEERQQIEAAYGQFVASTISTLRQMRRLNDEYEQPIAITGMGYAPDMDRIKGEVEKLAEDRRARSMQFMRQLEAVIGEERLAQGLQYITWQRDTRAVEGR